MGVTACHGHRAALARPRRRRALPAPDFDLPAAGRGHPAEAHLFVSRGQLEVFHLRDPQVGTAAGGRVAGYAAAERENGVVPGYPRRGGSIVQGRAADLSQRLAILRAQRHSSCFSQHPVGHAASSDRCIPSQAETLSHRNRLELGGRRWWAGGHGPLGRLEVGTGGQGLFVVVEGGLAIPRPTPFLASRERRLGTGQPLPEPLFQLVETRRAVAPLEPLQSGARRGELGLLHEGLQGGELQPRVPCAGLRRGAGPPRRVSNPASRGGLCRSSGGQRPRPHPGPGARLPAAAR